MCASSQVVDTVLSVTVEPKIGKFRREISERRILRKKKMLRRLITRRKIGEINFGK